MSMKSYPTLKEKHDKNVVEIKKLKNNLTLKDTKLQNAKTENEKSIERMKIEHKEMKDIMEQENLAKLEEEKKIRSKELEEMINEQSIALQLSENEKAEIKQNFIFKTNEANSLTEQLLELKGKSEKLETTLKQKETELSNELSAKDTIKAKYHKEIKQIQKSLDELETNFSEKLENKRKALKKRKEVI